MSETSLWQEWLQHPEKVWLRKCFFYVHVWLGLGAGVYVVLMSITGSLIVFRDQLEKARPLVPAVEWIVNLHENLLSRNYGRFVNGVGASCMILLCVTGAVIWWPGISNWRRALIADWRSPFARFNWDLHSALGFWSLPFVLMWGISGLYFVFPDAFNGLFGFIDPGDRFTDPTLTWLSHLHFGRFGWLTEAFWTLLGLVPAVLFFTGFFLCCRRVIYKIPPTGP